MKKKSKEIKFTNQSVLLSKVIVTQGLNLMGSGYLITKLSDGKQRLDIMDLKGNHINPEVYQINQIDEPVRLGITSLMIN